MMLIPARSIREVAREFLSRLADGEIHNFVELIPQVSRVGIGSGVFKNLLISVLQLGPPYSSCVAVEGLSAHLRNYIQSDEPDEYPGLLPTSWQVAAANKVLIQIKPMGRRWLEIDKVMQALADPRYERRAVSVMSEYEPRLRSVERQARGWSGSAGKKRGQLAPGSIVLHKAYYRELTKMELEKMRALGEARADVLLVACAAAGIPFDENLDSYARMYLSSEWYLDLLKLTTKIIN